MSMIVNCLIGIDVKEITIMWARVMNRSIRIHDFIFHQLSHTTSVYTYFDPIEPSGEAMLEGDTEEYVTELDLEEDPEEYEEEDRGCRQTIIGRGRSLDRHYYYVLVDGACFPPEEPEPIIPPPTTDITIGARITVWPQTSISLPLEAEAELLSLREQQRRARQPGPEARIPDHQDASGMLTVTSSDLCYFILLGHEQAVLSADLTWWNGQIRTSGPEAYAMTWEALKKKMTDKVKGNDVPVYTERFQELTLICTKFISNETEKVDKYISGLLNNILIRNVKSADPRLGIETIEYANDLMDQKLQPTQNVAKVYLGDRLNECLMVDPCQIDTKRHLTTRARALQEVATKGEIGESHKGNGCFSGRAPVNFQKRFSYLKKNMEEIGRTSWFMQVGNAEKRANASRKP
ncbi:hypothetical protein Tco_0771724 [Tanacetum coccineum]|uniref:Reverse transcriptase domain-containing protein n=1 Tax=Tanacetum coccineum TaxID=301880 RepID=A0ABQ4ZJM2_9ASTR